MKPEEILSTEQPNPAPETGAQPASFGTRLLVILKTALAWTGRALRSAAAWIGAKLSALWAWYRRQHPEKQRTIAAGVAAGLALALAVVALWVGLSAGARQRRLAAEAEAQADTDTQESGYVAGFENLRATEEWEDEGWSAPSEPEEEAFALKKHDQNEDVTTLQTRLIALGYLEIDEPTDYYGSATEYAVKLFQRQHELETDGVAGAKTLELLYSDAAQKYTLKEGAEGRDVKMLQEQLADLGYLSSKEVDSVYGEVTQAAVKAFQKRNKLTADGKAGEKTLDKLYSDDAKISSELESKQKAEAAEAAKKAKAEAAKAKEKQKAADAKAAKDKQINRFISAASSKVGCEYVLGDRGPDTFDCSGFVWYCLKQAGVSTTRLNAAGYSKKSGWKEIKSYGSVQKGDILFFRSNDSARVSHTGIYIGNGMMIDASSSNGKVVKRSVSAYWKKNFVNARRPWA